MRDPLPTIGPLELLLTTGRIVRGDAEHIDPSALYWRRPGEIGWSVIQREKRQPKREEVKA